MEPDPRVVELLAAWEEARARGRTLTPEQLCADCPELLDAVRENLSFLRRFDTRPTQITAADPSPPPGGHSRYRFDAFLARGGMGEVWRGTDTLLGREVALKVLGGGLFAADAVPRFRDEARLLSRLQHPSIVPLHDLGDLPDGRPFFVMKLVEGRTLADLLRQRPNPRHDRGHWLQVFGQVCQAVAFAHSRGILHRDLKPGNVMVGAFGEVQVMDWGLAKLLAAEAGTLEPDRPAFPANGPTDQEHTVQGALPTRTGHVKGTAAYMAPEQARGQNSQVSTRSDVFGLGGILCVILTGQAPYEGQDGVEVLRKAEAADLAAAFARLDRCGADAALIALAKRCLRADPNERPRDAAEVAQALEQWRRLDRLHSSLPPAGLLTRTAQAQPYLFTLLAALLPHAVGAALVSGYVLLWAAADPFWHAAVGLLAALMLGYSVIALLATGVVSTLLTRPMFRVLERFQAGSPVAEAEAAEARRQALLLHGRALLLCAVGWLPGGFLVPWLLGGLFGSWDGALLLQFVLAFAIAGLTAMTYCTLATDFVVLRIAYPQLWLDPRDLPAAVGRELRGVPGRLRTVPLLAALVPLAASVAVMVNVTSAGPLTLASAAGRLFHGLVIVLVVLGMVGSVLAGLLANYLRRIVSGIADSVAGGEQPR
jgi:hypothetical protein